MAVTKLEVRPGAWRLRRDYRDDSNRRQFKYQTVKGTEKQAEKARIAMAIKAGTVVPAPVTQRDAAGSDLTVGAWGHRLMDEITRMGSHERTTLVTYGAMVGHVTEMWGEMTLAELTREDIVRGLGRFKDRLSARTVRHIYARLGWMLSEAVKRGGLTRNPAVDIKLPRVERKGRALTGDEVRRLLDAAAAHWLGPMVRFAFATGLRRGEICGLRWSDFDAERGTVTVERVLAQQGNGPITWEKAPKSRAGSRSVSLPASVLAETKARMAEVATVYAEMRMPLGTQPMFLNGLSEGWKPGALTQAVGGFLVNRAKLPGITLHDLRHAHATALLRGGGNPRAVSQRLGHASPSITLDTYAHALPADDARLAEQMEDVLE